MAIRSPSIETATRMLARLTETHTCGYACTGTAYVGGMPIQLSCPYARLDPASRPDRRIIAGLYNEAVREALPRTPST